VLFAELVATSQTVGSTRSRLAKVEALAKLLHRVEPDEIAPAVGFLAGLPMQGKIGVGWARLSSVDVPHAAAPSLTVADLDAALTRIQETTGSGSNAARAQILGDLLRRATVEEADFVRRLLVGELRHGALEGVMIEAIARTAGEPADLVRRTLMLSGDLGETARIAILEGAEGLGAVGLEVMRPIRPMLASIAEDLPDAMSGIKLASVEWKLDGLRIQVHRKGDEVRVFTRNLNEISGGVPEVISVALKLPAESLVVDGEAILVDEAGMPHAFQDTMSGLGTQEGKPVFPLVPYFFDCLYVDGRDLIDLPLTDRLEALESIAGKWRIPSMLTSEVDAGAKLLDEALEAGHEGVMVKASDSTYQAGRRGRAWKKVKPARTLDLVVLGAEWGHGRRRGSLSNLHLGARDPEGGFVMVGKTFKGLTDELLRWQTEKFQSIKTRQEGITVFIRPELVVEIELDGVQKSPRYPGGVALRFARVLRYRSDKSPDEADTIDAVRALRKSDKG
jgi:ATP-dependent DNA ligase I